MQPSEGDLAGAVGRGGEAGGGGWDGVIGKEDFEDGGLLGVGEDGSGWGGEA